MQFTDSVFTVQKGRGSNVALLDVHVHYVHIQIKCCMACRNLDP